MAKTRASASTKATGGKKRGKKGEGKSPRVAAKTKPRASGRKPKSGTAGKPPRKRTRRRAAPAVTIEAIKDAVREVLAEHRPAVRVRELRGGRGEELQVPARPPAGGASRVRQPAPPLPPLPGGALTTFAAAFSVFPGVRSGLDTAMCRLVSGFSAPAGFGEWQGSGVLIGRRTVLTVGHNLFNKFDGATPARTTGVTVFPGPHQNTGLSVAVGPGGCWHPPEWEAFASDPDYQSDNRFWSRHDYGLVNLPEGIDFGDFTPIGWNAVDDSFTPEWFRQNTAFLFGYPKDRVTGVFPFGGRAVPVEDDALDYPMIAAVGMSGGPLMFFYQNGGASTPSSSASRA